MRGEGDRPARAAPQMQGTGCSWGDFVDLTLYFNENYKVEGRTRRFCGSGGRVGLGSVLGTAALVWVPLLPPLPCPGRLRDP